MQSFMFISPTTDHTYVLDEQTPNKFSLCYLQKAPGILQMLAYAMTRSQSPFEAKPEGEAGINHLLD